MPLNGNSARRNKGQTSQADVAVFRRLAGQRGRRSNDRHRKVDVESEPSMSAHPSCRRMYQLIDDVVRTPPKCNGFDHEPVADQLLHLDRYLRSTRSG
ncbi:hypothetical protein D5S19_03525 [Amycolatopsis panacis]|uniref:Uncharacterized protein n=1 Tax=Amycolatopsis panacis TaxID=2340917 RepID=A0A419IA38_9PSEU|nr:hypothetical protein D5S19_03525 [Amycolatopsis panacis]